MQQCFHSYKFIIRYFGLAEIDDLLILLLCHLWGLHIVRLSLTECMFIVINSCSLANSDELFIIIKVVKMLYILSKVSICMIRHNTRSAIKVNFVVKPPLYSYGLFVSCIAASVMSVMNGKLSPSVTWSLTVYCCALIVVVPSSRASPMHAPFASASIIGWQMSTTLLRVWHCLRHIA